MRREHVFLAPDPRCRYRFGACPDHVVSRGLCQTHYNVYREQVRLGRTTWKVLEDAGLCLPKQRNAGQWVLEQVERFEKLKVVGE